MSKKKKVLFVATVVKKHINVFHLPYLQWFQEQGYETHVCAKDDFDGEKCIIPYCDVHYDNPFERSPISGNNIKAYKKLKRIIDENEYDIIHCHTPVAAMLTRLAAIKARKKGTKVIYTAHGFHFFKGAPLINWLVYYPVEWICSWVTDVLITMNQEDYQLAKKTMKAKKIEYVYGVGVDTEICKDISVDKFAKRAELGIPKEATIVLSVGELSKRKNHEIIIEALSKVNNPSIIYIICGQGNLESYLKEKSETLKVPTKFMGFRKDILEICMISDIFAFPSLQEGLPVALMEAMSTGLPVACSKIRGNMDLIEDTKGGYLVKATNSNEFADAIKKMVNQNELCNNLGKYNMEQVRKYDKYNVLKQMSEIYLNIGKEIYNG